MLSGYKELNIDEKGRLVLPSKYRDVFSDGIAYVQLGPDFCLSVYSKEGYNKIADKIFSLNSFDPKVRRIQRYFSSNTEEVEIDSHNRISISKRMMDAVSLKKNVVIVGVYDHLEIWDKDNYQKSVTESTEDFSTDLFDMIGK